MKRIKIFTRCWLHCGNKVTPAYCVVYRGVAITIYFAGRPMRNFSLLKANIGLQRVTIFQDRCVLNLR